MSAEELALLKSLLIEIRDNDLNYEHRYKLVLQAVATAVVLGLSTGFRIDPNEPEWPVAYIDLPTGQVSWHMPQYANEWDGHTTAEKYDRITQFTSN